MSDWNKPSPTGIRRKHKRRRDAKRFKSPYDLDSRPGAPSNVDLTYKVREKKADLWFKAIVTADSTVPGACAADIEMYEAQIRPRVGGETKDTIQKEFYFVNDPDDVPETLRFEFGYLEHVRTWGWQVRVRAIAKNGQVGEWGPNEVEGGWSNTYDPPWYEAAPHAPAPTNLAVDFHKGEKDKHEPRWVMTVDGDEMGPWDIPPVDASKEDEQHEDDIRSYEVIARRCDAAGDFIVVGTSSGGTKYVQRQEFVPAKDQDADERWTATFANVRKRHKWKVKARSIDRFGRPGDWSDWTAVATALDTSKPPLVRHPVSGTPGDFIVQLDQHKLTVRYDYKTDDDDTDADLKDPDPDIIGVQIQVSDRGDFDAGLSNYWNNVRIHHGMDWVTYIKKPAGTLHVRIRTVDGSGNKGDWSTKSENTHVPPTPDNVPDVTFDHNQKTRHHRLRALATVTYNEAGYNEDHISRYQFEMQGCEHEGFGSAVQDLERKTIEANDGDSVTVIWNRVKPKWFYRSRYRVVDKQGRESPWGDWS